MKVKAHIKPINTDICCLNCGYDLMAIQGYYYCPQCKKSYDYDLKEIRRAK